MICWMDDRETVAAPRPLFLMNPWKCKGESSEEHLFQDLAQGALLSSCPPLEHHYSFTARCLAFLAC